MGLVKETLTLCTGASLYAPYNLLLISNKFWMGGEGWGVGGGEARGPSWRRRIRGVKGENKRGGAGWLSSLNHLSGPSRVIKFLYSPAPPPPTVWALDLPRIHPVKVTRGLVCMKQPRVFWAPNGTRLSARCHFTGPKKLSNSRAQPPPTSPRHGYARIKNIMHGAV